MNNQLYPARANALAQFDENERKLLEAQSQLADAQENVNSLEAKFFIMDRTKNYGAINFNNDAERIASIANVFPLMFFFVALIHDDYITRMYVSLNHGISLYSYQV